jgi:hypothetical protein
VLLTAAIVLVELGWIARLAVDFDQPAVRVVRIDPRIDLVDLHRTGRERAELAEMDLCRTLPERVLAEQLPVGFQVGPHLGEKRFGVRERALL